MDSEKLGINFNTMMENFTDEELAKDFENSLHKPLSFTEWQSRIEELSQEESEYEKRLPIDTRWQYYLVRFDKANGITGQTYSDGMS